jgi:hypothetical protein
MEEIKILLGDAAPNYSDALISLCYKQSLAEVEAYCRRDIDATLEYAAQQITVIKLNRMGSEGLASQGYSGVSESYINDYPADIKAILNRKRRLKVI